MTAEQFHDALTALPAELVAQADLRRSQPRARRRFVPLAAGLAAVLLCGFMAEGVLRGGRATESAVLTEKEAGQGFDSSIGSVADEAAPMEAAPIAPPEAEVAEDAASRELYPGVTFLSAVEVIPEEDSAVNHQSPAQVIARKADLPEALNLPELTEDWFESHDLLALFLPGYPEPPEILAIQETEITLPAPQKAGKTWFLLLQTQKAQFTQEKITLVFRVDG